MCCDCNHRRCLNGSSTPVGSPGSSANLLALELVLGQLRVTTSLMGSPVSAQTEAVGSLSDGQWHTVQLEVTEQVRPPIMVVAVCNDFVKVSFKGSPL